MTRTLAPLVAFLLLGLPACVSTSYPEMAPLVSLDALMPELESAKPSAQKDDDGGSYSRMIDRDRRIHDPRSELQTGWTGFGGHIVVPTGDDEDRLEDGFGASITVGYFLTHQPIAIAIETAGYFSYHDTEDDLEPIIGDDFWLYRWLLGGRVAYLGWDRVMVPYVRGGFAYRFDDGDDDFEDNGIDNEDGGTGYYAGAGLDFTIVPGLSIAPQVLYTSTDPFGEDAEELFYGLEFNINY